MLGSFIKAVRGGRLKAVDLTHKVDSQSPTWTGGCGFHRKDILNYGDDLFLVQELTMSSGIGTHMNAPSHLFPGGKDVSEINLEHLIAPVCVVDIRKKVRDNPSYKLTLDDMKEHEQEFGDVPDGALLAVLTGWSKYWGDATKYRNVGKDGEMCFPGIEAEVAENYIYRLNGIGIDTLSPDGGNAKQGFPVHEIVLGKEKWTLENLNNLDEMPACGGMVISLPLNFKGCSESPARVVGVFQQRDRN